MGVKKAFGVNIFAFDFYFTFMHLADTFYPKRLTVHSGYTFIYQYVCSLGIEPMTFALLTQCSTTEPQEHYIKIKIVFDSPIPYRRPSPVVWDPEVSAVCSAVSQSGILTNSRQETSVVTLSQDVASHDAFLKAVLAR